MIRLLIILMFFSFPLSAVNISEYEAGELTTLSGYTDLSGGAWVEKSDGTSGAAYVDNKSGIIDFPNGSCGVGGDLEAVVQYQIGKAYTVNEAKNGVSVVNIDNCNIERRFLLNGLGSGSDGVEGIELHNGVVYVLDERSATIYTFVDDGFSTSFTPSVLFSVPDCNEAGDLTFNGDNIVIACDSVPVAVEYTLTGDFVSQVDYSGLANAEVIYFDGDNNLVIGGEPNQIVVFTNGGIIDPPPPPPPPPPVETEETCTFSGSVIVNIETGSFDSQTVNFVCPTITASGTLN